MSQIFDVQIWDFGFASFSTSILTLFLIWDWERVGLKNLIQSLYNLYFRVWLVVVWFLLNLIKTEHNCGKHFQWFSLFAWLKTFLFGFEFLLSSKLHCFLLLGQQPYLSLPSWEVLLLSHFGVPPFSHSFISHCSTTMKHGLSYWSILRVRDLGLAV